MSQIETTDIVNGSTVQEIMSLSLGYEYNSTEPYASGWLKDGIFENYEYIILF